MDLSDPRAVLQAWNQVERRCGSYRHDAWRHAVAQGFTNAEFVSPDYPCGQCCFVLACTLEGRHDPTEISPGPDGYRGLHG
jgi:hypothetical protein